MSRHDKSPVGYTCSDIDEAINIAEGIKDSLIDSFVQLNKQLEKLRTENASLREWGNEMYNQSDDLEKERDDLIRKVSILEGEVMELKKELHAAT